jgi:hypothetical protein
MHFKGLAKQLPPKLVCTSAPESTRWMELPCWSWQLVLIRHQFKRRHKKMAGRVTYKMHGVF